MPQIEIDYNEATLFAILLMEDINKHKKALQKKIGKLGDNQWNLQEQLIKNKQAMLDRLNDKLGALVIV